MNNARTDFSDFEATAEWLNTLGSLHSPAELHGMLCGRFCGGGRYTPTEWPKAAQEFLDLPTIPANESSAELNRLYTETLASLDDEAMQIEPLLPEDSVSMPERLQAMSQWCEGFLAGFGGSGITGNTQLPGETADILRDFAAFTQIDHNDVEEGQDENDYMEIVEYIRVAMLTVFMEIGRKDVKPKQSTVH